jgi:hypothetical protein
VTAERPIDATADYRPVSPLAVAALVAGLCSALALVTPFAWALPLVGTALACAALADVARPEARKAGRLVALAALALSLGFRGQAVPGLLVDRWIMGGRAKAAAQTWIDAVREGRTAEALGLCTATVLPISSLPPGLEHEEAEAERLRRFAELPAVKALADCGAARPLLTHAAAAGTDDGAWTVQADLAACGASDTTLRIAVAPRTVQGTSGTVEQWRIMGVGLER